jgi:hypothetical protein
VVTHDYTSYLSTSTSVPVCSCAKTHITPSSAAVPLFSSERQQGERDGGAEAERMLVEATRRKGAPLTWEEIQVLYCTAITARMHTCQIGEISQEWFSGWTLTFANTCMEVLHFATALGQMPPDLGRLLRLLRQRSHVLQYEVAATLALFSSQLDLSVYAHWEAGDCIPAFAHLAPLYKALTRCGVTVRFHEREAFLVLARRRITCKRTHREYIRPAQWETLATELVTFDREGGLA